MNTRVTLLGLSGLAGLVLLANCSSSDSPGGTPVPGAGTGNSMAGAAGSSTAGSGGLPAGAGAAGASGAAGGAVAGAGGAAGGATAGSGGMSGGGGFVVPTVAWPSDACKTKTAGLLAQMTKAEKAAQMVMAGTPEGAAAPTADEVKNLAPGAVFSPGGKRPTTGGYTKENWAGMVDMYITAAEQSRLKIPILYGVDAVHGMNAAVGTVIFPHNVGLGSTKNPALVQEVARITALEATAMGVTWTFAPVVSVSFDDRWGRVYESFSEDPTLTGLLSAAATMGLQGPTGLGSSKGLVGCSKHWAGDGQATAGTSAKGGVVDRGDIRIDEAAMRKYGIAPYLPAIQAGLGSIMVSDATWNKASLTSHKQMIETILKGELKFQGFVATDWNAADTAGGVMAVVNAGVDMLMQPADWKGTINTIAAQASDARLNDAVTRILNTKCQSGLFEFKRDPAALASVGSAEHRAVGRKAVAESLVVMQNTGNVLPMAPTAKVWVGGSGANSLKNQCGGWTIGWQSSEDNVKNPPVPGTTGTTILQAITKVQAPVATMDEADTVVVVLSEGPYAEFLGDKASIDTLPPADFALVDQAKAKNKKVVAIVISGRPVLLGNHLGNADAWIAAWLPGTEGDGVADILYGKVKPTGKLSHSWPKTNAQANVNFGDAGYDPLFKLGDGIVW